MSFYVFFSFLFQNRNPFLCLQRPKRATPEVMTHLHTDEYINFLEKVTPETVKELTGEGTRCASRALCATANRRLTPQF